jgi:hypothetical protein
MPAGSPAGRKKFCSPVSAKHSCLAARRPSLDLGGGRQYVIAVPRPGRRCKRAPMHRAGAVGSPTRALAAAPGAGCGTPPSSISLATRFGPVAQRLEPAAHNGLVGGSSPSGPTSLRAYALRLGKPAACRGAARKRQGCRAEAKRRRAGRYPRLRATAGQAGGLQRRGA